MSPVAAGGLALGRATAETHQTFGADNVGGRGGGGGDTGEVCRENINQQIREHNLQPISSQHELCGTSDQSYQLTYIIFTVKVAMYLDMWNGWIETGPAGVLFPIKIELRESYPLCPTPLCSDMTHISQSEAYYRISISSLANVLTAKFRWRKSMISK